MFDLLFQRSPIWVIFGQEGCTKVLNESAASSLTHFFVFVSTNQRQLKHENTTDLLMGKVGKVGKR